MTDNKKSKLINIFPIRGSHAEFELETLFSVSPVGIIVLDENRRYISANQAYQEMLGYTESELQQKTVFDTTFQDDLGETNRVSQELSQTGNLVRGFKKRKLKKDGSIIWVAITSTPMKKDGQKLLVSVVQDITEQVKADEELKRSHSQMQNLFKCMSEGMVLQDQTGAIIHYNPAALEILGLTENELLGRTSMDTRWKAVKEDETPFEGDQHPAMITLKTGQSIRGVVMGIQKKDGQRSWISINSTPVFIPGTLKVEFAMTTFTDITEQKLALHRLIQGSKMASLGEMSGNMAHEINNPLTIIIGKVDFLRKKISSGNIDTKALLDSLDKIHMTADRIAKIVRGLRSFSSSGEWDNFEPTEMSSIFDEVANLLSERARQTGISLSFSGQENIQFHCQQNQISQALVNMLSNSIDAIEAKSERWIKVESKVIEERTVQIRVTDSGGGIPPEIADKIMNPFFTTKDIGKGTGLGLSVAHGIISSHGGQLYLDNKSKNTSFVIELPLKPIVKRNPTAA